MWRAVIKSFFAVPSEVQIRDKVIDVTTLQQEGAACSYKRAAACVLRWSVSVKSDLSQSFVSF